MSAHATADHGSAAGPRPGPIHRWVLPMRPTQPLNPALLKHAERRADYEQNRIADRITAFAGSMAFVYIHIIWFGCWIGFGVEEYPFGLLTMIVSLEAIFLSTFVMISQNRADAKRQVLADQQWRTVQDEDRQISKLIALTQTEEKQNEQLLDLSKQILNLTQEVRRLADASGADSSQNKELLELVKRNVAMTEQLHRAGG
jgi:uncharacterized membrane protein